MGGTTVLRGGKNVYDKKVLIGNWKEDRETIGLTVETTPQAGYSTTSNVGQQEGARKVSQKFGRDIRETEHKSRDIIAYQEDQTSANFCSIARLSQTEEKREEFNRNFGCAFQMKETGLTRGGPAPAVPG